MQPEAGAEFRPVQGSGTSRHTLRVRKGSVPPNIPLVPAKKRLQSWPRRRPVSFVSLPGCSRFMVVETALRMVEWMAPYLPASCGSSGRSGCFMQVGPLSNPLQYGPQTPDEGKPLVCNLKSFWFLFGQKLFGRAVWLFLVHPKVVELPCLQRKHPCLVLLLHQVGLGSCSMRPKPQDERATNKLQLCSHACFVLKELKEHSQLGRGGTPWLHLRRYRWWQCST